MVRSRPDVETMEEKDPTESSLLSAAIKEAFEAAKSGNFFTSYGIAENDVNDFSSTSALNDEDDDALLREKLRNFTNCVTDTLVSLQPQNHDATLTPKKKRKKVHKSLLAEDNQELILSEIRQLLLRQRNNNTNGTGEKSNEEGDEEGSRSGSLVSGLEDDDYASTSISTKKSRKKSKKRKRKSKERERGEKKKKKHKKRRREKEILSEDENNYSEEDPDDEPLQDEPLEDDDDDNKGPTPHQPPPSQTYQEAKEAFERKRDHELSKIPKEEKARFRQVVFVKWNKQHLGALVLSPFDVADPVRGDYLYMAQRTQNINRAMTVLIFWFGTEDFSQAYSFVPKSNITSFEEGMKQNLGNIPKKIQTKIDKGLKLTKQESQIVRGLEEMQIVAKLEPEERVKHCAPEFNEEYEEQFQQGEIADETIEQIEAAPSPEEKKGKKTKAKKEKPPKRKPGRPKKKVKEEDVEVAVPKKKVAKVKKSDDIPEDLGDPELSDVPSDDDEHDDDFSDGNGVESEEEDADFEEGQKGGNRKRKLEKADGGSEKKPKRKRKADMTEEEFAEYEEERKAKKRQQEKERRERKRAEKLVVSPESSAAPIKRGKKTSIRERLRQEQAAFTECEQEFLPIMDDLNTFVESNEADLIKSCLESLLEKLDIITPPFIREYLVGLLIKKVRTTFSDTHPEIKTLCKTVTSNMKRIFGEKDELVPENFKPKKLVLVPKEEKKLEETKNELKEIKNRLFSHQNDKEVALESRDEVEPSKERSEPSTTTEDQKEIVDTSLSVPRKNPKPVQETPAPAPIQKPPRKSFSIKGLFDRPKTPVPSHKKMPLETQTSSASERISKRDTPSWVTSESAVDPSLRDNDERLFALEFLVDASLNFPSEKYNHELIAVQIEASIFNLSKRRVNDAYWEKVHDIATALAEKRRKGLLVQHILNGDFPTVDNLVKLSRKELHAYLEGGNTN